MLQYNILKTINISHT